MLTVDAFVSIDTELDIVPLLTVTSPPASVNSTVASSTEVLLKVTTDFSSVLDVLIETDSTESELNSILAFATCSPGEVGVAVVITVFLTALVLTTRTWPVLVSVEVSAIQPELR